MSKRVVLEGEMELENGSISLMGLDRRVFVYHVLREWLGHGATAPWVRVTVEEIDEGDGE